jgi:hypothetical protein
MKNKKTGMDGYTKELVEKSYERKLTDKQWEILVDFCEDEPSVMNAVADFMSKIDWLEEQYDEYNKLLVEIHGQEKADEINGKGRRRNEDD